MAIDGLSNDGNKMLRNKPLFVVALGDILLQILAYLLKKKAHLLNSRILHLVLSIGGTMEAGLEQPTIKNLEIFQHIVCNFEVMMLLFVCLFVGSNV